MKKDYKKWHPIKKDLDNSEVARPFFHQREIWFCYLGENVGFEEDGVGEDFMRPVIIIRKFNNEIFWGIPLTKRNKKSEYYFTFYFSVGGKNAAILSQIRLIDAKRLAYKIGEISDADFNKLIEKLKELFP